MNGVHKPCGPYEKYFKRPIDIACALAAIIVFFWLYIIIAVMVRINLGSPIIFTQERPGKNEKIFKLYKFRTMTDERDENGNLLPDEMRLTKFGAWLRRTSLDELPEAFNILEGTLSVVGPRPLMSRYIPYYTEKERHRHDVRPGLTGYAQIHGRNMVDWSKRFELDLIYIENISFIMDISIILHTVWMVLKHEGIDTKDMPNLDSVRTKETVGVNR